MRNRWIAAAACAAILLGSFLYAPFATTGPVLCPLRFATGLDCPGCGLTRSFAATSHGHLAAGFGYHWLGPILFFATAIAVPVLVTEALRRRRLRPVRGVLFSYRLGWTIAGILVLQWVVRMATAVATGTLAASVHHSVLGGILG